MLGGKKKNREQVEVNAGSMADVAFLLLIFFLVATTIVNDKAFKQVLPPYLDEPVNVTLEDRNVLNIIVNNSNQILVEEDILQLGQIRSKTKQFISNNGSDNSMSDSPTRAVVSIKGYRGTDFGFYTQVYNEIRAGYDELRAEKLGWDMSSYLEIISTPPKELTDGQISAINKVKKFYPMQLSEAEQE